MRAWVVCILIALLLVYIVVGGIVFHFLEWENEEAVRADTSQIRQKVLELYPCLTEESLQGLISTVITAYDNGVIAAATNQSTQSTNWDWYSSIFFATTVVTTIGYGNISPATQGGQIFCVVFAILGIPLCLIVLGAIGYSLNKLTNAIQKCVKCNCIQSPKVQKGVRAVFSILMGVGLLMVIPAVIFTLREDWTMWESFYYCFITLTTIGFGDYVAGVELSGLGSNVQGIYRLCISGWILIGLAWMSSIIALYQEQLEKAMEKVDLDMQSSVDSFEGEKADMNDFQNIAFTSDKEVYLTRKDEENVPSTQL